MCCLSEFINGPRITIEECVYLPKIEIGADNQMKGITPSVMRNNTVTPCPINLEVYGTPFAN